MCVSMHLSINRLIIKEKWTNWIQEAAAAKVYLKNMIIYDTFHRH